MSELRWDPEDRVQAAILSYRMTRVWPGGTGLTQLLRSLRQEDFKYKPSLNNLGIKYKEGLGMRSSGPALA